MCSSRFRFTFLAMAIAFSLAQPVFAQRGGQGGGGQGGGGQGRSGSGGQSQRPREQAAGGQTHRSGRSGSAGQRSGSGPAVQHRSSHGPGVGAGSTPGPTASQRSGSGSFGSQGTFQNRSRSDIRNRMGVPQTSPSFPGGARSYPGFTQPPPGNLTRHWPYYSDRDRISPYTYDYTIRPRSRHRDSPYVYGLLLRYPTADRILWPRPIRKTGVFFWFNSTCYYYPYSTFIIYGSPTTGSRVTSTAAAPPPAEVVFGGYVYIDELSAVLPEVVNDLCLGMHYNYQHNSNYAAAYRNAYALLQVSRQIRAAFEADDRPAVANLLREAKSLLDLVQDQTQGWTRQHTQQVGELGLLTKLEVTADMIHYMMYDVGVSEEAPAP